jgi:4-amino-4-deoxy-L-arabinose transferase-like glycosyltransferase
MPSSSPLSALLAFDQDAGREPPEAWFYAGLGLLLALFAAPLFYRLGAADLDNDEAIYAHAVTSIVDEGAWATPWSSPREDPFLEKPPLKLWIVAAGQLAGLKPNELGMRFFDPLFGALALVYIYLLGCRAGGVLAGLGAGATLFLFAPLLFDHGLRQGTMDAALLLSYCGGAWHFLAWIRQPPRSRSGGRQLLAATLFFTFGFLVKFVAALFLPLAAGAACLLHPDKRQRLGQDAWLLAAAAGLFALLAAPWFLYQHSVHGALFWPILFGQQVVERLTHHLDPEHVKPFGYYFARIAEETAAAGSLPWMLLGGALWLLAWWRTRSFFGLYALAWAAPLLAISCGTSKLIHYAYPFLPPLCLFAGFGLALAGRAAGELLRRPRPSRARLAIAALLAAAAAAATWWPAFHYGQLARRLGQGEHPLRDLGACLRQGAGLTLVEEGQRRPLFFVHAFRSDGMPHPFAYYSRQGAELQQLEKPDEKLLFFRLYLPPHQAATLVTEPLWSAFRESLADPAFRQQLLQQARGLDAEAETARLLEDPAALLEPPGFATPGWRYFLPGPYAACLPR